VNEKKKKERIENKKRKENQKGKHKANGTVLRHHY
jgi:hypothetical protein